MQLKSLTNGKVQYVPEKPAKAETKETIVQGGVTINNIITAVPGMPAHFEVSFLISCSHEVDGIEAGNIFHIDTVVPAQDSNGRYREIEDRACRTLPALLRELADSLEADIARVDEEAAEKAL